MRDHKSYELQVLFKLMFNQCLNIYVFKCMYSFAHVFICNISIFETYVLQIFFHECFSDVFFNAILDVIDAVKVDWSLVVIKLMHKIILLRNLKMKCMLIYLQRNRRYQILLRRKQLLSPWIENEIIHVPDWNREVSKRKIKKNLLKHVEKCKPYHNHRQYTNNK